MLITDTKEASYDASYDASYKAPLTRKTRLKSVVFPGLYNVVLKILLIYYRTNMCMGNTKKSL